MGKKGIGAFLKDALTAKDGFTVADLFEQTCDLYPSRPAWQYVGCEQYPEKMMTFSQMDAAANQVARWAREVEGLKPKDTVALYMENRLEYVMFWLGLCKAGVRIAFINNTIKNHPLVHSIAISEAKLVVFGIELEEHLANVFRDLTRQHGIECVCSGGPSHFARSIDSDIMKQSLSRPEKSIRDGIKFTDVFGYVYTSGTTGLPKAVNVTHLREWAFAAKYAGDVTENDVVYSAGMPLYHSAAGGIGSGMVFQFGACQIIRKKFSAKYWLDDIRRYSATVCQYIGELCRYVLTQPETGGDCQNKLRLATGNGLSKEIWVTFQSRFGIDQIIEFYGSTEGNGAFRNSVLLSNIQKGDFAGVGCVGKLDRDNRMGVRFVRYDVDKDQLVRDPNTGGLVDCAVDEPGECIFPIKETVPGSKFVGYTDKKATEKKLVEDGISKYVRTGDLLMLTKDRWVKFVDRIGDTFRWRGENVSTFEVASELSKCSVVQEANVYGVQVPHIEGRAGMAAVVLKPSAPSTDLALEELLDHAKANLPSYSVPIFLRVQEATATTQTFKHQKVQLRNEGIDPSKVIGDKLFWLHPDSKRYKPFSKVDFESLENPSGNLRSRL